MSVARPSPSEFFFDRSLGKVSARLLRDRGWTIHLIADFYERDAARIGDEEWISEGCSRGWSLLTKDQKIRYRASQLAALGHGHLFCLANGNLPTREMAVRFQAARSKIERVVVYEPGGFWHVYEGGVIKLMWPPAPIAEVGG